MQPSRYKCRTRLPEHNRRKRGKAAYMQMSNDLPNELYKNCAQIIKKCLNQLKTHRLGINYCQFYEQCVLCAEYHKHNTRHYGPRYWLFSANKQVEKSRNLSSGQNFSYITNTSHIAVMVDHICYCISWNIHASIVYSLSVHFSKPISSIIAQIFFVYVELTFHPG